MSDTKIKTTKTVKETDVKKEIKPKATKKVVKEEVKVEKTPATLTMDVYDLAGKVTGKVSLPVEIFGDIVNNTLLAQAIRVYRANKRQGNASTKTRGEVDGSTRKIYRQKGTGKARHGSIRAPIFVKGGIVFGPKPRDFGLQLPKKMRRKALYSALSSKFASGEIKILSGLEAITPKTKEFAAVVTALGYAEKKRKVLLVTAKEPENVKRAARNVEGINLTAATRLNAYDVLATKELLFMKDAIDEMKKNFLGEK